MKLNTYVIGQGDIIEILAQILLGDFRKADTLIKVNNLRYPYISDAKEDQFANAKGKIFLTTSYSDPDTITVNNLNNVVILENDVITLSEGDNFSSGVVKSISGNVITFQKTVAGDFDEGAIATVYVDQNNITTQVLRTGDTLLYPADSNNAALNNYSLVFGTDWKLDDNGFLVRNSRDVDTVSGIDNLAQALKMRLQTAFGTLMQHLNYGNKLFLSLGEGSSPYFSGLAKHYTEEAAMQDERIQSAEVIDFAVNQDQMTFKLKIIPLGSQDTIVQPISIKIGGV